MAISDQELKKAALIGLRSKREEVEGQIRQLEQELGAVRGRAGTKGAVAQTKRVLSAAARKRIADAQRKRWAAVRKAKKGA